MHKMGNNASFSLNILKLIMFYDIDVSRRLKGVEKKKPPTTAFEVLFIYLLIALHPADHGEPNQDDPRCLLKTELH